LPNVAVLENGLVQVELHRVTGWYATDDEDQNN
jgi:hypothetical protein